MPGTTASGWRHQFDAIPAAKLAWRSRLAAWKASPVQALAFAIPGKRRPRTEGLCYLSLPRIACARNVAAHSAEDCCQVIHARVALRREHAMQAFARKVSQFLKPLEPQSRIN